MLFNNGINFGHEAEGFGERGDGLTIMLYLFVNFSLASQVGVINLLCDLTSPLGFGNFSALEDSAQRARRQYTTAMLRDDDL